MKEYDTISIDSLFSSTQKEKYLLSCNVLYYEASSAVVELVKTLQNYQTEEEAIAAYINQK